jgi:hypothetical protein
MVTGHRTTTTGFKIFPRYRQVQIHGSVLQPIFCMYVLLLQICWPILIPCTGAQLKLLLAERSPRHAQLCLYQEVSTILQNNWDYNINNLQADGASTAATPTYVERDNSWKLTQQIDNIGNHEELVLRLQGIICQKDLPPIRKTRKM